jgi:hypothetical protein
MDDVLPWLGYLAAYMAGGIFGLFGAALFCGAAQSDLRAENEALREQVRELEERLQSDEARLPQWGSSEGLAA